MAIEALYPYIAVAYGTFGLVFGVFLWSKTREYIFGTRHAIEKQVAAAITDIGTKVDTKLDKFVMPDLTPIMARIDAIDDNIPDFDQDVLLARLDTLETRLPDMIGTHISMAIKGVQATEGKQIAAYVESLGIEGLTAEAQEAAVARLTVKQRMAYQLMTMKVPPKTKREHPVSTMVFEQSRGLVVQQLIESDTQASGNVQYDNRQRSGFNPGYNP